MSAGPILEFRGEYRFLSNFFTASFVVPPFPALKGEPRLHAAVGEVARTSEHAFQALKCVEPIEAADVLACEEPGEAKRLGRRMLLRPDWEEVKQDVMLACLRAKFAEYAVLRLRLAATGYRMLVEGNTWGDMTWGACWAQAHPVLFDTEMAGPCWARRALLRHDDQTGQGDPREELRGDNWLGRLLMLVRAELDCGVLR